MFPDIPLAAKQTCRLFCNMCLTESNLAPERCLHSTAIEKKSEAKMTKKQSSIYSKQAGIAV